MGKEKVVVIACGTAIATPTVVASAIEEAAKEGASAPFSARLPNCLPIRRAPV